MTAARWSAEDVTRSLLAAALAELTPDPRAGDDVAFTGWQAGLLSSSVWCLPAMVASVAAALVAIADVDAARRGRAPETAHVDVGHVAVAARSERFGHLLGQPVPQLFAPLSRFWRTGDGWIRTHANYPWHRDRLLAVLGCDEVPSNVQRAIDGWCATDLEQAAAARGALAFAVRTRDEWLEHAQGRAVALLPVLTTGPVAGRSRGLPPGRLLEGVRVLDLTRVIAGPVATRTLAAWGADVLRVDSPRLPEVEEQTYDALVGKRSAYLDLATRYGQDRLELLLAAADVVVSGYRPGSLDRYGLSPGDLFLRHPHLTVLTLSAWGKTGPWAGRRGFDSLVQAPTGLAVAHADADGTPGVLPAQVLDHATGYLAAAAAAAALASVARGGTPRHVDLSLAQTAEWLQGAGPAPQSAPVDPEGGNYAVELPRPGGAVVVVSPPGLIGETAPSWRSATRLGADPVEFAGPTP